MEQNDIEWGKTRQNAIDTTGMLCTCGKKLNYAGTDNGCHVLVCPVHSKKSYRIPMTDPGTLPFPWETPKVKVFRCRDCGSQIDEDQAVRTFKELERAMCISCEAYIISDGRISVMAFGV